MPVWEAKNNRFFNSFGNRSYVITYSLKKMKKEERDIAMEPTQFRIPGSNKIIDLRTLDETDETVFNTIYYKEVPDIAYLFFLKVQFLS